MTSPTKAYLETRIRTATPEALRLMLIDGAIRFARQGREALGANEIDTACEAVTRAQAIVTELMASLRPEHAPELCANLQALYVFVHRRLGEGLTNCAAAPIDEALGILETDRETWSTLVERAATEGRPDGPRGIELQG